MATMLKCGHAANAKCDGKPVCVICFGINPGADEIADAPNLTGREAKCDCGRVVPSSTDLPFFQYGSWSGKSAQDRFYCGCRGWD
jgi:hypothetical protein